MPRLYATKNATKVDFMRSRTKWQVNSDFEIKETNSINGQSLTFKSATTSSALTGAIVTLTNLIPAGALVLCVDARVTTAITGATTWKMGITGNDDKFGDTLALTAGTTVNSLVTATTGDKAPYINTAADSILITANGSNFTAGAVRVTVHYIDLTPATS